MAGVWAVSDGGWLTARRVRAYSLIVLVLGALATVALVATSRGGLDYRGRPLGTDFSNVYAAGRLVLDGAPADAYRPAPHYAEQQRIFGAEVPFYGWHYPPMLLLPAAALALLPYAGALAAWMALTLPLYLAAVRLIAADSSAWLPVLAYPAVFVNLIHGQNGFLTTGLLGLALLALERRPLLAGVLIGCLTYKPQFGVLIPFALAAGGHWRAFAAAAATALAVAGLSWAALGTETWVAFIDSTAFTRTVVLEQGDAGWHKLVSVFAAARLLGAPVALAYAAQSAAALAALGLVVWGWRKPSALNPALLVVGALLATPYAMDYDLVVLALPVAWLAAAGLRDGFLPWEKAALAAVFALPLFARPLAEHAGVPLAPLVVALLAALLARRIAQS